MFVNGHWIYWKEQCDYCKQKDSCENKGRVKNYIENLDKVDDTGCYGTLCFRCDYFNFDKETYEKMNPGDYCE